MLSSKNNITVGARVLYKPEKLLGTVIWTTYYDGKLYFRILLDRPLADSLPNVGYELTTWEEHLLPVGELAKALYD